MSTDRLVRRIPACLWEPRGLISLCLRQVGHTSEIKLSLARAWPAVERIRTAARGSTAHGTDRHDEFLRHSGLTRGLSGARDHSNGTPKLDAVDFGDRKSGLGTLNAVLEPRDTEAVRCVTPRSQRSIAPPKSSYVQGRLRLRKADGSAKRPALLVSGNVRAKL
jgi:hypothetical protein